MKTFSNQRQATSTPSPVTGARPPPAGRVDTTPAPSPRAPPGRSGAPGGRHLPRGVGHGPGQKVCWDEKIGSNRRFYRFFLELTRDFN